MVHENLRLQKTALLNAALELNKAPNTDRPKPNSKP